MKRDEQAVILYNHHHHQSAVEPVIISFQLSSMIMGMQNINIFSETFTSSRAPSFQGTFGLSAACLARAQKSPI